MAWSMIAVPNMSTGGANMQVNHHSSSEVTTTKDWKGMKTRALDPYDTMSSTAMIALKTVPFGFDHGFPRAAVNKRRLVLECRRDSAASADLRATECTNPIDSVQAVTARFKDKLRISVLRELVVCKIAINPVNTN